MFPRLFQHAMTGDVRPPRRVLGADTIIVSCGLEKVERTSWSKQHTHKLGDRKMNWLQWHTVTSSRKASRTTTPKSATLVHYGGSTAGSSTVRIATLEIHIGRNSRIMKSILGSKDFHELHNYLCVGISPVLSQERLDHDLREWTLQFCCERWLWSSMLSCYGRYLHSVSLMHLSERDFWKDTCAGKCPECRRQSSKTFQKHYDCVRAECSRLAAAIGSETEHRKRPRRKSHSQGLERSRSFTSTSTTNASIESNTKQGTLSELAERRERSLKC